MHKFTHAPLKEIFDETGWLKEVYFNDKNFKVIQAIDNLYKDFYKEI